MIKKLLLTIFLFATIISANDKLKWYGFDEGLAKAKKEKPTASERSWEQLGLRLAPAVPSTVQQLQPRYRGGLLVQEVRFGSPGSDKGIRPGDILVGLHIWETVKPDNVSYILDQIESDELETVKFYILRGRDTLFGHLTSDTILR